MLRGHFEGAVVIDLFAGVGTMGLEALSQGATSVLMVEQDRRIFKLLERNVQTLDCADRADLLCGDALGAVALLRAPRPVHVCFVDPPFAMMQDALLRERILTQIQEAGELLDPDGYVVLRTPLNPDRVPHDVPGLDGPEVHAHGKAHYVCLYSPQPKERDDECA